MARKQAKITPADIYRRHEPEIDLTVQAIAARWILELDVLEADAREAAEFLSELTTANWQYAKVVDSTYNAFLSIRNHLKPIELQYADFYMMLAPALRAAGHLPTKGGAA